MTVEEPRPSRRAEIDAILDGKGDGVAETRDDAEKYTVVGAASRETFADWLTPIDEHFVCHRNDMPSGDAEEWEIALSGQLQGTVAVADLTESYPTVAVAHTMECAGNGRGQHQPETGSVQWGYEAAATAFWTGTPLSSVLRNHGVEAASDRWLTAVGGDRSTGEDVFARSIPLAKALDDCILATAMNGQPLPREHGFPVRLIVPGWYGVNNVKWVAELRVMGSMVVQGSLDRPGDHAFWQQQAYRIHPRDERPTEAETVPTTDTRAQLAGAVEHPYTFDALVMSIIGTPTGEKTIRLNDGGSVEIRGVAWAGEQAVDSVAVSTDGGESWQPAQLFGPAYDGAWRLFRLDWAPEPGRHVLYSRATDEQGRRQPARISDPTAWRAALGADAFPWNEGGYAANAYRPNGVVVEVES